MTRIVSFQRGKASTGRQSPARSAPTSAPKSSAGANRKKPVQHEYHEQVRVFEWASSPEALAEFPELKWLHSTLNGVRLPRGLSDKCWKSGLKKGPFDIILDVRRHGFSGARIELKRPGNKALKVAKGTVSADQQDWGQHYADQGFFAVVCYGADAAIRTLTDYLRGEP